MNNASPIEQWQAEFAQAPQAALDRLLSGRAYMGELNRNELSEILYQLFYPESSEVQESLDTALRGWLAESWLTAPESMPASRWAGILEQVFFAVHRLNLADSRRWLISSYAATGSRAWLRSLYLSPACDPEGCLLRTLAMTQENHDLAPLWLRLCRMEEDLPRHYAAIGLAGLCRLPERKNTLSPLLFKGLISLAEAIDCQVSRPAEKKEAQEFWLRECRAIMALNPHKEHYWLKNFQPFLGLSENSFSITMLQKVIPNFLRKAEKLKHEKGAMLPYKSELQKILDSLQEYSVHEIRSELDVFLNKNRDYALKTGISEYLVKTFCNIGNRIYKRQREDAEFARQLLKEAFRWEPYNPYVWIILAEIESRLGNYSQAEELLWEAKRRFPENVSCRNILSNFMIKQGKIDITEAICRQTTIDFQNDIISRNTLADILTNKEELKEAEKECQRKIYNYLVVYIAIVRIIHESTNIEFIFWKELSAIKFPSDCVNISCSFMIQKNFRYNNDIYRILSLWFPKDVFSYDMTEAIEAQEERRFSEAEQLYRQTMADFPQDVICRNGLAEVLKRQGKLDEAEELYRQTMADFPQDVVCRTGLAEVLKMQGMLEEAEQVYRRTMADFPQYVVCRAGLAEVLKMQGMLEEAEELYRQTMLEFPDNVVCRIGLAEVLRLQGKLEAIALLEETVKKFPNDKVAKEFLAKVEAGQDIEESSSTSSSFAAEEDSGFAEPASAATKAAALPDQFAADTLETELGLISLHRQMDDDEAARALMEKMLAASPSSISIPARLEQGFLQLKQDPAAAAEYFRKQSKLHPNTLGFRLGLQRAQAELNSSPDEQDFRELAEEYPAKATLIRTEQFCLSSSAEAAEKLRKQVISDISHLPAAERGREQWLRTALQQTMFAGIDMSTPVSENILPKLAANCSIHALRLHSAADQCMLAA